MRSLAVGLALFIACSACTSACSAPSIDPAPRLDVFLDLGTFLQGRGYALLGNR